MEIYQRLVDAAPKWLDEVNALKMNTPSAAFALSFSSLDTSAPPLTFGASTAPFSSSIRSLRTDAQFHFSHKNSPQNASDASRQTSQPTSAPVYYDGAAQATLADLVEQMESAQRLLYRNSWQGSNETGPMLVQAMDLCRKAATQLLHTGKGQPHLSATSSIIQELATISRAELAEKSNLGQASDKPAPLTGATPVSAVKPAPANLSGLPSLAVADLGAAADDDDDNNEFSLELDDPILAKVRFTSRMR